MDRVIYDYYVISVLNGYSKFVFIDDVNMNTLVSYFEIFPIQ